MLIVNFKGGLGNQMFQYAFFCSLQNKGIDVTADCYIYDTSLENRKFELKDVFGIELPMADSNLALSWRGQPLGLIDMIRRKYGWLKHYYRDTQCYHPEVYSFQEKYLDGYWQSYKYSESLRRQLRQTFSFPDLNEQRDICIKERIMYTESVSVHVRGGDYLNHSNLYGGICTHEYYRNAIEYVKQNIKTPIFFIFSDDVQLAHELFEGDEYVFIDNSHEAYRDMQLMSYCRHHIIANSSFSWWGAYLGDYNDAIVIAPSKWMNRYVVKDIWCDNWVKLGGNK